MAINSIGSSPAAGIDNVLAQLRMAQARTQGGLGTSAAQGAAPAQAGQGVQAGTGVLRGRLSLSDDSAQGVGSASAGSFVNALQASLAQVNSSQQQATKLGQAFEKGEGNVDLQDVMVAMQKANVSFQGAVQVRNRLVSAYHDIMNMQI